MMLDEEQERREREGNELGGGGREGWEGRRDKDGREWCFGRDRKGREEEWKRRYMLQKV